MNDKTPDRNVAPTAVPIDDQEPLIAPVLPPWGSMFPNIPPAGYGDISFDPENPRPPRPMIKPEELSEVDRRARELLLSLFPARRT